MRRAVSWSRRRSGRAARPLLLGFALLGPAGAAITGQQPAEAPAAQPGAPPAGGATQPDAAQPGGNAAPAPTSLQAALTRAYARNPTLLAAHERTRQAEAQARAAGLFPAVIANAGEHAGQDAAGTDQDVLISGRVPLGGKLQAARQTARRALEAARATEAAARLDLALQVQTAYFMVQEAAALEQLANENLSVAKEFLAAVSPEFRERAQSEVYAAERAVSNASQNTSGAKNILDNLLGEHPDAPIEVTDAVLGPDRDLDLPHLRELLQHRPDIRAAEATLAAREAAIRLAQRARRPDITADYAHRDLDELDGNVLRVGVEAPVWDFGLTRANVALARHTADEQQALLNSLRLQALLDVEVTSGAFQSAQKRARDLERGAQLAYARAARDKALTGFKAGRYSYIELLDAQRAYQSAFNEFIAAVATANINEVTLEHAIGEPLPAPPVRPPVPVTPPQPLHQP